MLVKNDIACCIHVYLNIFYRLKGHQKFNWFRFAFMIGLIKLKKQTKNGEEYCFYTLTGHAKNHQMEKYLNTYVSITTK